MTEHVRPRLDEKHQARAVKKALKAFDEMRWLKTGGDMNALIDKELDGAGDETARRKTRDRLMQDHKRSRERILAAVIDLETMGNLSKDQAARFKAWLDFSRV